MKKTHFSILSLLLSALVGGTLFSGTLSAQTAAPEGSVSPTAAASTAPSGSSRQSSAAAPSAAGKVRVQAAPRTLAPHVFRKIDPALDQIYMVNTFNLKDGSQKDLPYRWAKNQPFFNSVWYFDFEIKSLRTIVLPSAILVDGQKKPILKKYLYLLYRIKNPARYFSVKEVQTVDGVKELKDRQEEVFGKYQEDADALQDAAKALYSGSGLEMPSVTKLGAVEPMPMSFEFTTQKDKTLEFTPLFELRMEDEQWLDPERKRMVLRRRKLADEYNPYVVKKIAEKERPSARLYGSCDFIGKKIKPEEEVWGVAIWSDVNFTADRFSIVINGLTNVRKYEPEEGKYFYKNLKLNYWHPGDLDIFRFGQPGGLDFEWIFE